MDDQRWLQFCMYVCLYCLRLATKFGEHFHLTPCTSLTVMLQNVLPFPRSTVLYSDQWATLQQLMEWWSSAKKISWAILSDKVTQEGSRHWCTGIAAVFKGMAGSPNKQKVYSSHNYSMQSCANYEGRGPPWERVEHLYYLKAEETPPVQAAEFYDQHGHK